jgi:Ca2+-binding EF-hand superfamily protein
MISGISGGPNGADLSAMWEELLRKADKDRDGKISREELKAAMPQGDAGPGVDNLFNKIDTNHDGFIDESENAAAVKKMHRRKRHGTPDPLKLFKEADKDRDGKISKADLKAVLPQGTSDSSVTKVFDSMDTNKDGLVDASEYAAAMQKTGLISQLLPQQGFSTLA